MHGVRKVNLCLSRKKIQMLPGSAIYDIRNGTAGHSSALCHMSVCCPRPHRSKNLSYRFFGQFGTRVGFATQHVFGIQSHTVPVAHRASPSSLLSHILHIVNLSPSKQMSRIDAGRVVTAMKHKKFCRYASVMKFPTYSVSQGLLSFNPQMTISLIIGHPHPQPTTTTSFIDLGPKTQPHINWRSPHSHIGIPFRCRGQHYTQQTRFAEDI